MSNQRLLKTVKNSALFGALLTFFTLSNLTIKFLIFDRNALPRMLDILLKHVRHNLLEFFSISVQLEREKQRGSEISLFSLCSE
jgi:hypothetical protein